MENLSHQSLDENEPIQKTFAVGFHRYTASSLVGLFIESLEKRNLSIIDLKLMSVSAKFAKIHLLSNKKKKKMMKIPRINPIPEEGLDFWVKHLSKGSVVAMILEGKQAIQQVSDAADHFPTYLEQTINFFGVTRDVYCSDSEETVEEDIKLWFNKEHDNWSDDYLDLGLGFVFPDEEIGKQFAYNIYPSKYSSYSESLYTDELTFMLIRPVAFKEQLVGRIIDAFDSNCDIMRGMKLVTKQEFPVDEAWGSDGDTAVGVVVVFHYIAYERISWLENANNHCSLNRKKSTVKIDSNLVFISEPGEMTTEHVLKCFPFGFVIRPNLDAFELLEPTMNGYVLE